MAATSARERPPSRRDSPARPGGGSAGGAVSRRHPLGEEDKRQTGDPNRYHESTHESTHEMLMVTVLLVCLMGFYGWLGWTCGYDRGWADRDEGRPHRDLRKATMWVRIRRYYCEVVARTRAKVEAERPRQ